MKVFRTLLLAASVVSVATAGVRGQTAPVPPVVKPGEEHLVPPAPRTSGGANLGSAQMYAYVLPNGTVMAEASKGTAPCTETDGTCRAAVGQYRVRFQRDVSNCAVTASLGSRGTWMVGTQDTASAATTPAIPDAVLVGTNSGSGFEDRSFYIIVMC